MSYQRLNPGRNKPVQAPFYYPAGSPKIRGMDIVYDVVYWIGVAAAIAALVVGSIALSNTRKTELHVSKVTISDRLDISGAMVHPAPHVIIVGQPQSGVVSFPGTNSARDATPGLSKDFKHPNFFQKRSVEQHTPTSRQAYGVQQRYTQRSMHTRLDATLPVVPTVLDTYTVPSDAVSADNISQALSLVHGKVIVNTTILVHPGTYNEDIVIAGLESDCVAGTSQNVDPTKRRPCSGLSLIGDTRRIAGWTYVNGGSYSSGVVPEMGASSSTISLVCVSPTSVRVDLASNAFSSYPGTNPDFNALYLVAGDILTMYDMTGNAFVDKTVTGVSGNVIEFAEPGCAVDDDNGDAITIQPNRIIQCQGLDTAQDAGFEGNACVRLAEQATLFGFRVVTPEPTKFQTFGIYQSGNTGFIQSVVVDARLNPNIDEAFFNEQSKGSVVGASPDFDKYDGSNSSLVLTTNIITVLGPEPETGATDKGRFNVASSDVQFEEVWVIGAEAVLQFQSTIRAQGFTLVRNIGQFAHFIIDRNCHASIDYLNVFSNGAFTPLLLDFNSQLITSFRTIRIDANGSPFCLYVDNFSRMHYGAFLDAIGSTFDFLPELFANCGSAMLITNNAQVRMPGAFPAGTPSLDATSQLYLSDVFQQPTVSHTASGAIRTDYDVQLLAPSPAAVLAMTLSDADIAAMSGREFAIYSETANAHTITLSGSATWDGTNQIATLGGAIGDGLSFRVLPSGALTVTSTTNVVFS